jgi:hypothetical protein
MAAFAQKTTPSGEIPSFAEKFGGRTFGIRPQTLLRLPPARGGKIVSMGKDESAWKAMLEQR